VSKVSTMIEKRGMEGS